jgi:hypothetical protein
MHRIVLVTLDENEAQTSAAARELQRVLLGIAHRVQGVKARGQPPHGRAGLLLAFPALLWIAMGC